MKKLTPIRVAILITALLALGAFIAYSASYRPNAPAPPERIYDAPPPQARRVLFIGNSHTYVHDVPGMVQRLGEANGTPIWVEALTIGGASLSDHLRGPSIVRRPYKPSARHCQFGCKTPAHLQL